MKRVHAEVVGAQDLLIREDLGRPLHLPSLALGQRLLLDAEMLVQQRPQKAGKAVMKLLRVLPALLKVAEKIQHMPRFPGGQMLQNPAEIFHPRIAQHLRDQFLIEGASGKIDGLIQER